LGLVSLGEWDLSSHCSDTAYLLGICLLYSCLEPYEQGISWQTESSLNFKGSFDYGSQLRFLKPSTAKKSVFVGMP
jgi:hypothetical protein